MRTFIPGVGSFGKSSHPSGAHSVVQVVFAVAFGGQSSILPTLCRRGGRLRIHAEASQRAVRNETKVRTAQRPSAMTARVVVHASQRPHAMGHSHIDTLLLLGFCYVVLEY